MKNKLIAALLSVPILFGACPKKDVRYEETEIKEEVQRDYFATINMSWDSGMAINSGDFDGDGDLDLIIGVADNRNRSDTARIRFYENDGKGNFTLRRYKESEIQKVE